LSQSLVTIRSANTITHDDDKQPRIAFYKNLVFIQVTVAVQM